MKKTLLFLLCFFAGILHTRAQDQQPAFLWATQAGGPTNDHLIKLKADSAGNQYVLGYFSGEISFSSSVTLTSPFDKDYFIAKYNAAGQLQWARRVSNDDSNYQNSYQVNDLHVDISGMLTLAGSYSFILTIGNDTLRTGEKTNIFYARFSADGSPAWAYSIGSDEGEETAKGIDVDNSGNIYLTGHLLGNIRLDKPERKLTYTAYVLKTNAAGNILWVKQNTLDEESMERLEMMDQDGGVDHDMANRAYGQTVKVDKEGNVIVAGEFNAYILWGNYEFIGFNRPENQVFVIKLNPAGEAMWAKSLGGNYENATAFNELEVDQQGNVFIAGHYKASIGFGVSAFDGELSRTTKSSDDLSGMDEQEELYIIKIAPDGTGRWLEGVEDAITTDIYSKDYTSSIQSLHITEAGKLYVTGYITGHPVTFDSILVTPSPTQKDRYVAEISPEGNWLWVNTFSINETQELNGEISTDKAGNILLAGEFSSSIQLGEQQLTSSGGTDLYLTGIRPDTSAQPIAMKVTRFVLVDAQTNQDIMALNNWDTLYLNQLPAKLNIRAETTGHKVGSVMMTMNSKTVIENVAPYALAGDRNGNYHAMDPLMDGRYMLSAIPFSQANAKGETGLDLTIGVHIRQQKGELQTGRILGFTLVNADTEQDIMQITEGTVLYLDQLPKNLNIRANADPSKVGSVYISLNSKSRLENEAPYTFAGDKTEWNGKVDYYAMKPLAEGEYMLEATPYNQRYMTGERGLSMREYFTVKRSAATITFKAANDATGSAKPSGSSLMAYPNPFTDKIILDIYADQAGKAILEVFDLQGRSVKHLFDGYLEAGSYHRFTFEGNQLPAGMYLVRMLIGAQVSHQRIMLSK